MKNFINKFKIPTLLGLGIIIIGIGAGVFLTLKEQSFISKASPDSTPQNITLSNISDDSINISWQTSAPTVSFISFGQSNPDEQTILDERDTGSPKPHTMHYVTIKNLLPKTTYQYKIITSKISTETLKFTTAAPLFAQTGFQPIIGSVLDNNTPVDEAIVYLSIADATTESALAKNSGNFLIPISQLRKADLSDSFPLTDAAIAKLTIISGKGQASALFKLEDAKEGLPPISLGADLDLTTSNYDTSKYDLNGDGKINAADNAIILQNFGPNLKDKRADLNKDGVVDQEDLDLMAKQINQ
ncbi:MAG: Uncharacterized protein G01um10147_534 [Microgenomates group bacterium Gr01-1014_7]|nr:MAG: Uncharacterized protein G01um10147_534 [Microgenomates group bacterium Gr01-1014_7]